ncbi:hypothetical protein FQA39_LY11582 [Lamprigera yunnana]|nr:hypothetical protein FQA39_LY11582 [Lamprigera yunnana]
MNSCISKLVFVIFIVTVNSICLTLFILLEFNIHDGIATLSSLTTSICILFVKVVIKNRDDKTQSWIKYSLILFMTFGGTIAFLWFFYLLYRLFNFDYETLDLLLNCATAVLALAISIHLIFVSHQLVIEQGGTIVQLCSINRITVTQSKEVLCTGGAEAQ